MRAGNLDRRIQIEQAVETQDPASGEVTQEWELHREVWAEVKPLQGNEFYSAQQWAAKVDTLFRIRYPLGLDPLPNPDESMRIVYKSKVYNIQHVAEIGRREGLEILAQARAEAA